MKARLALGGLGSAAMIVVALLFVACSPSPSPASRTESTPKDTKPFGSVTIATRFGSGHLDPLLASGQLYDDLGRAVWDSLLIQLPNGQRGPGVAERWEISPDGKTHTFYIRKGVKFHNGDDLTAADVKFSIDRMLSPESIITSDADIWRAIVASVAVKNDYTVAISLKGPSYDLLKSIDGAMGTVMPKNYIERNGAEAFKANLIGSGPWKVKSFTVGTKLELEALDSHWRAVPAFKYLTALNVTEEGTAIAMLKTGELDMALVSPDSIPNLKSAGLRITSYDGGGKYWGKVFYDLENPDKYALGDKRVRKALVMAINAKQMADSMFNGAGGPYAVFGVSATASFYDPNVLKPDPFDTEGAKRLLAEAGYPNGFSTALNDVGGGSQLSTINAAVAGYWRAVGVDTKIVPMDYGAHRNLYRTKVDPSIFNRVYIYFSMDRFEFESMAVHYHSKQGAFRNTNNLELDKLIDKVPATADPVEKKRLMLETAVMAKADYSTLPVLAYDNVLALGPKIGTMQPALNRVSIIGTVFETITHPK